MIPRISLRWHAWVVCPAVAAHLFLVGAAASKEKLRHNNVLYLEDYLKKPVELKTVHATPLTFTSDGTGILDGLRAGQTVTLVGLGTERYLVETRISTGRAQGWVVPSDMEQIPEEIRKELREKVAEADRIKQAIAKGQIVIGMPQDAVAQILGKPKEKSTITEAEGSYEQWTYVTYKSVPVYVPAIVNGTNTVSTFYQKVPVGTKIVTFQNQNVIRYETRQDDAKASGANILVPPVFVQ